MSLGVDEKNFPQEIDLNGLFNSKKSTEAVVKFLSIHYRICSTDG
jgi:hypothetical protein